MTRIIITAVSLLTLTGCTQYHYHHYYTPRTQNVPLFKEKNELRASVAEGIAYHTSSLKEIQAAYSITNNFAVMSNYMHVGSSGISPDDWARRKYFDAAIGYFKTLGKHGVFEIFGGIGGSNQHHHYVFQNYNFGTAELSFIKIFLQPSLGLTFNFIDLALTTGISNVAFNKINYQIDSITTDEYFHVKSISRNRNHFLFEPAYTIRIGWKHVKLHLQLMLSLNLSHPDTDFYFHTGKLSFGLTFALAERFRKKTKTIKNANE